jgi:hypothetical protein
MITHWNLGVPILGQSHMKNPQPQHLCHAEPMDGQLMDMLKGFSKTLHK